MILIWGTMGPFKRPTCIGAVRSRTHMQFIHSSQILLMFFLSVLNISVKIVSLRFCT